MFFEGSHSPRTPVQPHARILHGQLSPRPAIIDRAEQRAQQNETKHLWATMYRHSARKYHHMPNSRTSNIAPPASRFPSPTDLPKQNKRHPTIPSSDGRTDGRRREFDARSYRISGWRQVDDDDGLQHPSVSSTTLLSHFLNQHRCKCACTPALPPPCILHNIQSD